ncbi:hypothetical protein [Pseudaeromonas paramecii]|uniref:Uncharacterized protein n=1 Tax=Pseudaeromonas paramecii TaxID=2138166 RepID=A0ABP8Q3H0_9GAMM
MAGHYASAHMAGDIAGDESDVNRLLLRDMASNFAGGWAENSARQWLGVGGKREWSNIAIDAFGNALGNSIVGSYQKEAGENMTAALRERTLATDQEKIQAHYAALGQELRRSREIQAQLASAAPSAGISPQATQTQAAKVQPSRVMTKQKIQNATGDNPSLIGVCTAEETLSLTNGFKLTGDGFASLFNIRDSNLKALPGEVTLLDGVMPLKFMTAKMGCFPTSHALGGAVSARGVLSEFIRDIPWLDSDELKQNISEGVYGEKLIGLSKNGKYDLGDPDSISFGDGVEFSEGYINVQYWRGGGKESNQYHFTSRVIHPVTHELVYETTDGQATTLNFHTFEQLKKHLGMTRSQRAEAVKKMDI